MLLDEPMAGMGHEDIDRTAELIRKVSANRTILMVEHNLSVVSDLSDKITVLRAGRDPGGGAVLHGVEGPAGDGSVHGDGRRGGHA